MSNKILVTGSTGTVGSLLVKELLAQKASFTAMVRNPEKAKALNDIGVDVVMGDFTKLESLDAALKGREKVFLLSGPDQRQVELQGNLVRAAKKAGVKHLVKLSALGAGLSSPVTLLRWHGQTEKEIEESGIAFTHLRPHYFMQNTLMFSGTVSSQGAFYGPFGGMRISLVDARDVAAVAASALTRPGHENQAYDITGPEALSMADVAAKLSTATGKSVNFVAVSSQDARKGMVSMGMPDWLADGLLELMGSWTNGNGSRVTNTVEEATGRSARTYDTFAGEHVQAFK